MVYIFQCIKQGILVEPNGLFYISDVQFTIYVAVLSISLSQVNKNVRPLTNNHALDSPPPPRLYVLNVSDNLVERLILSFD